MHWMRARGHEKFITCNRFDVIVRHREKTMNGYSSMTTITFRKLARNGLSWARLSSAPSALDKMIPARRTRSGRRCDH
jgi:hypothetical protein